jgi:hypothetical protein
MPIPGAPTPLQSPSHGFALGTSAQRWWLRAGQKKSNVSNTNSGVRIAPDHST